MVHLHSPGGDWQLLAELELPVGSSAEDAINAWLVEVLGSLDLQSHFLSQVLRSAQEAARRAMSSERAAEFRHIHFLVHTPTQPVSDGQTWGFFQIEKTGDPRNGGNPHDHAIEFYLYLEG